MLSRDLRWEKLSLEKRMAEELALLKIQGEIPYKKLLIAVSYGNIKLTRDLIISGVCINPDPSEMTDTPLYLATICDQLEMVNFLIRQGANVNQPSRERFGSTSLVGSIVSRNLDIFNVLLEHGANAHFINPHSKTSTLHRAVELAEYRFDMALTMINKLIELGVDINLKDQFGDTALDKAEENIHGWTILKGKNTALKNFSILKLLLTTYPAKKLEDNIDFLGQSTINSGKTLTKFGTFSQLDASESGGNRPTQLQYDILKGFVGFRM